MKILYKAIATSTGGRDQGHSVSSDKKLDVRLSAPKEMGGPGGEGTNPEQLFAAGYSACFLSALKAIAGKEKVELPSDSSVTAQVGIGPGDEGKGYELDIELHISLPGFDNERGRLLVEKAHQICPYSNATRGNVLVRLVVAETKAPGA